MGDDKFYDCYKKVLIFNLIATIGFSCIVFLFNISLLGTLVTVLAVSVKLILWLLRDSFNLDETNDNTRLTVSLCFITLFFAMDAIIYNNFLPAALVLIIPIFVMTLRKDIELIKQESFVTAGFMIVTLIVSVFIKPFQSNFFTELLLFVIPLLQILYIIKNLTEDTLSLSAKSEFFKDKSRRDSVTGLYNTGTFYDMVAEKVQLMAPFCFVIINIDNFKYVKDTYGLPFGDYVLKTLVKAIKKGSRDQDIGFRYNGEDMAVIFPKTTDDEAFRIAEKIRKIFSEKTYDHNADWARTRKPITISIGLIENNIRGAMPQELIEKCDQALFYSKQHGKNQTTVYHEHLVEWEDKFEDFRRKYRNYER
jgi:diguanylate cyclase (GGDEF)-like protein